MSNFEGIWIPLVTPFKNTQVDYDKAQQLALSMLDAGVHGLVVCGTTGEAAMLSEHEQSNLLAAILEVVPSHRPVFMGISGSDTRALVQRVASLNQHGPTGYLVSAPSYVRPSQEGIRRHFEAIAEATDSSIMLYNIPARTGVRIELETIIALERHFNVVGIKECGSTQREMAELIRRSGLQVFCGDDAMLFDSLCLGAQGAISAAAQIRPDLFVQLFDLIRAAEIVDARLLFNQLLPMIQLLFSEPNPAPVKAALAMSGQIEEGLRLPMIAMSISGRKKLFEAMGPVMELPNYHSYSSAPLKQTIQIPRLLSSEKQLTRLNGKL